MKVLKKIKARIGLSHKQGLNCPPGQPLEFHPVHGDNVLLTQGNTIAARYVYKLCFILVYTYRCTSYICMYVYYTLLGI